MHVVRWIILSFMIVAIMIASSQQMWSATSQVWDDARPSVVQAMDGIYAIIRSFVAGSDPHEGIDDDAPGVNYDIIITLDRGNFS
jgi:hypothetical protein